MNNDDGLQVFMHTNTSYDQCDEVTYWDYSLQAFSLTNFLASCAPSEASLTILYMYSF